MSDRHAIAARHGIPGLAGQLVGETVAELEADAAARAALGVEPEPEHVQLARRVLGLTQSKAERDRAILERLHPPTNEGEQ